MERRGLTEPLRVQDEMRTTLTYGINRRLFCRVAGACALCKACAVRTYRSKYGIVQPRDGPALANTAEYTCEYSTLAGDPDAGTGRASED